MNDTHGVDCRCAYCDGGHAGDSYKELITAAKNILAVLDAHEISGYDCDRRGEKFCDCLPKAKTTLRAAVEKGEKV